MSDIKTPLRTVYAGCDVSSIKDTDDRILVERCSTSVAKSIVKSVNSIAALKAAFKTVL